MLKDITLGQYFPGNTIAHRLDPRTKIILVVLYIITLFVANNWPSYVIVILVSVMYFTLSKISFGKIIKSMKPILLIIIITSILNLLFTKGEPLFEIGFIVISKAGVKTAVLMALRLILLITGTFLLTYTTSPISLMDGLETLLSPLKKLKLPVHEFSMMMGIALRFIPTLIEETEKIMNAQKARGAEFDSGNLINKAKALLPLIVPLFISAFRRADELAVAMESRCYHGDNGRTRMHVLRMAGRDIAAVIFGFVILGVIIVFKRFGM